ncbi:hypothetical protein UFOVP645_13 [uncultured Caudovirales phage]|uniref:Uncharacterized protein n=1 Tax=uncultured Caudovirales phage TaxID=2100421 RepID=A0A6J5N507_9CAUD|nr:hypothetical protein UFOVP645_13 [uncultured Caudovirales phage]
MMATKPNVNERVAVLETKLDDVREDVSMMRKENREDHARVITKLEALEGYRNWLMGAVAIVSPALLIAANHYFK